MIQKEDIIKIIDNYLKENNLFLIEINISTDNDIEIIIESEIKDVTIDNCQDISKIIEDNYNREIEDFSLTVSSAGLDQPFKVLKQYQKYKGSEVEVLLKKGIKLKGILSDCNENGIELTTVQMEKIEGKKRKVAVEKSNLYSFDEIKSCKLIINFK